MLVVIVIVTLITIAVVAGVQDFKRKGRNSQALIDKENIILALSRAREHQQNSAYPEYEQNDWFCFEDTGSQCFGGRAHGSYTLLYTLSPYLNPIPKPPGAKPGELRYNSYVYISNYNPPDALPPDPIFDGPIGTYLIWAQEDPIQNCSGYNMGELDPGVYYCMELLPSY